MGLAGLAGRPLSQYRIRADRRVQLPLTSTSRSESAHVSVSNRRRPCMCVEVDARRNRRSGQRSLGTMEVKMQTLLSICVLPQSVTAPTHYEVHHTHTYASVRASQCPSSAPPRPLHGLHAMMRSSGPTHLPAAQHPRLWPTIGQTPSTRAAVRPLQHPINPTSM